MSVGIVIAMTIPPDSAKTEVPLANRILSLIQALATLSKLS